MTNPYDPDQPRDAPRRDRDIPERRPAPDREDEDDFRAAGTPPDDDLDRDDDRDQPATD